MSKYKMGDEKQKLLKQKNIDTKKILISKRSKIKFKID